MIAILYLLLFTYLLASLYLPVIRWSLFEELYDSLSRTWKIGLTISLGVLILAVIFWLVWWGKDISWTATMLDSASLIFSKYPSIIFYPPLYYFAIVISFALFSFQHYAFNPSFRSHGLWVWAVKSPLSFVNILNMLQLWFNLQFIKDTCTHHPTQTTTTCLIRQ